ncbi:MAG: class I SAM-dependent methyltransferase [Proteobacteria bacterium]|nr:class I SAM-dependent methyltransferase [Pseudomonadota bacterium]
MRQDYRLIDSGNFQKLEQVGPYRVVRPSPQAVWTPRLSEEIWQKVDATFHRYSGGDGKWTIQNPGLPKKWTIEQGPVKLVISLTDFGHLGIFPEQDVNWTKLHELIKAQQMTSDFNVLNLFAYTGGSTLACAAAGAKVVHLDASKTSVNWGRENAEASGAGSAHVRWIVDDVQKFVEREVRRGSKYQGVILDPPSFGRGTNNEVWQIEQHLVPLLNNIKALLADDHLFILLSSHSAGYTPIALKNLIMNIVNLDKAKFEAHEMLVQEHETGRALPSGASCLYLKQGV